MFLAKRSRLFKSILLISLTAVTSFSSVKSFAQVNDRSSASGKEFLTSCTYGVLAGSLVGAASLAFTDQPGQNLQRVARGASLGLYSGILLGLYVVYIIPGNEEDLLNEGLPPSEEEVWLPKSVYPLITSRGVEGVAAQWNLLSF